MSVYDSPRADDKPHATGHVTQELLDRQLPADRSVDVYFLGLKPFMEAVMRIGLGLGIALQRLRHEFFGPLESLQVA